MLLNNVKNQGLNSTSQRDPCGVWRCVVEGRRDEEERAVVVAGVVDGGILR